MELIEYLDPDMMMLSLAQRLSRELREALSRRDRALFVVPGGATPGPLFDLMSAADLDWERVDVVPGDERWVPEDHPRSNAAQIRGRLLRSKAASAHLIALYRPLPRPDEALDDLCALLDPLLPIDIALLGMGPDMHVASLFPGAADLAAALATDAPPVVAVTAPGADEPRVSLSARVLRAAYAVHVVIIGTEKRAALLRAQTLPAEIAPVAAVLDHAIVHWAP